MFSEDVEFPLVALNMMYRRGSTEQIGWCVRNHVEGAPAKASEIQDKLRAWDVSFIDSARHFDGGVLRGTDAYWGDRSDDVDAWLHYQDEHKNGAPTI